MTHTPQLVLYGRPGCHLCDDARDVLRRVGARHSFDLRECDIDSDDRLLRAYLERIPVVTIDGVETFELVIDADALEVALRASAATPPNRLESDFA